MLHLATCSHIAPTPGWNYTRNRNAKVCSLSRDELVRYAQEHGLELMHCSDCGP
jgi:hypothetical protein